MHPAPAAKQGLNRAAVRVGIAALVVLAVLAAPIKQRCGAPGLSCATAVDPQGNIHYYYEVEPLGVYLAEVMAGTNITIFYESGDDLVKAR
ncbi:hypothetical protein BRW65_02945 [Mycobacterium paraffinicum]|uniref:Uncharacterized protein n=1 Tax=Mycobacterium paraffinicum TaxID=53378 RepID=A0A1Q4I0T2_9MYCO|nr:hypothetical protein [Mycobacterium paraffinicum]OJZ75526.1 hypothetical protein BRW65_02945 [Mycobacterium paraffinicum]